MEEKKIGFFKKIWTSIRDFEKYEEFAADKIISAIKYILLLTLIFIMIITSAYTFKFHNVVNDIKGYVSQEIEEMSLENGKLTINSKEPIIIENEKSIVPIIIIDTDKDSNIEKHLEKIKLYDTGILVLNDKVTISNNLLAQDQSIYYSNVFAENISSKEEFINLLSGNNMIYTYMLFFITIFVYLFIIYFSSNIVDAIVLGALGYIFARIVRLRLRFKATFNIGIHALTLPIILNLIYIMVNTFTNFTISYFQWMYTTISYIYVAVAILMIKTEIINQKIQLMKLEKIQTKVAEEETLEEDEPKKKKKEEKKEEQKDEKEDKEKDNGEQPEGSNA